MTFSSSLPGVRGRSIAAALAGLAIASAATPASAAAFNVGPETVVRHLHDVRLQNGSGEPLYLGYKITYHWFGLPYSVSRGGYVFGVKDKTIQYELDAARVAEWQAQGHVPSPLPVYNLSAADYVLGHLMWIVAGLLAAWYGGKAQLSRGVAKSAAAAMARGAAQVFRAVRSKVAAAGVRMRPRQAEPQLQMFQQPIPRPVPQLVPQPSRSQETVTRLPVARTVCRVIALKVA